MKNFLLPFFLLLVGCAGQGGGFTQIAQGQIPDLNRQGLLACMGQPNHEEFQGGAEILIYTGTAPNRPWQKLFGMAAEPSECEAIFTLEQGRIRSINYRINNNNGSAAEANQCEFLIENCVH
jgi:hypothetical protein